MRELHFVLPDLLNWRLPVAAACAISGLPVYFSALSWPLKGLTALLLLWLGLRFVRLLQRQRQWSGVWLLDERQVRLIHDDGRSYTGQVAFCRLLFSRVMVLGLRWPGHTGSVKAQRSRTPLPARLPSRLWVSLSALPADQARRLRVWQNVYGLGDEVGER